MSVNLPQPKGTVEIIPKNLFNVRSLNDVIGLLYYVIPGVLGVLVIYGALDNNSALFWAGAATSIIQLIFQFARTADWGRRAIYTILNLVNAGLLIYVAGWSPDNLTNLMPLLAILLGGSAGGIASQNVNTSGDGTVVQVPKEVAGEIATEIKDGEIPNPYNIEG